jgi:hypothetical protein
MELLPIGDAFLSVNQILERDHYLGPIGRGFSYRDEFGVMVLTNPTSRFLPNQRWLEVARWCLKGIPNGGSQQWRRVVRWLQDRHPGATTVVSYSDPSVGHTGALYRACNWLWAPTWHRLREPPSGNGNWGSGRQSAKDRWVFCLQNDPEREWLLRLNDDSLKRKYPWAEYRERCGGDFKRWKSSRTA